LELLDLFLAGMKPLKKAKCPTKEKKSIREISRSLDYVNMV
jgi:hypothetical protein